MNRLSWLCGCLLLASIALAKTAHAPLPPALMNARSVYIDNRSGNAKLTDRCYDELSKWGRFSVVNDPAKADIIFRIGTHSQTYGSRGNIDASGNAQMTEETASYSTVSVLDPSGNILWSDTRQAGNLYTGFRSATQSVIKELRQRMEQQEKP